MMRDFLKWCAALFIVVALSTVMGCAPRIVQADPDVFHAPEVEHG